MREAVIHLPKFDNDGFDLATVHKYLIRDLVSTFGGLTIAGEVQGHWFDDIEGVMHSEPVIRYIVAMEPNETNRLSLRHLALRACTDAKQKCIYVVHANLEVEFVK